MTTEDRSKERRNRALQYAPAVTVAAGVPIIGSIGKKLEHRPGAGRHFGSIENFSKALKPGDLLLTGHANKLTPLRFFISMGLGTPRGYHAEVVEKILPGGRIQTLNFDNDVGYHRNVIDLHALNKPSETRMAGDRNPRNITAFRVKSEESRVRGLRSLTKRIDAFEQVRKELVNQGLPKEMAQKQTAKAFTPATGGKIAFRELFVPYFSKNESKIETSVINTEKATDNLLKNIEGTSAKIIDSLKKGKDPSKVIPSCLKGVCSSAVGTTFSSAAGRDARLTSPADIMRSKNLEAVGSYLKKGKTTANVAINPALKYSPHLVRGGFGLALGAGTLLATKAALGTPKYIKRYRDKKGNYKYEYPKTKLDKLRLPKTVDVINHPKEIAYKLESTKQPTVKVAQLTKERVKDKLAPLAIGTGVGTGIAAQNYLTNISMSKAMIGKSNQLINMQAEGLENFYTRLEKSYMGKHLNKNTNTSYQRRRNLLDFWHGPSTTTKPGIAKKFKALIGASKGHSPSMKLLIDSGLNFGFLKIPITAQNKPNFKAPFERTQNKLLPMLRKGAPRGKALGAAALAGLMVGGPTTVGAAYMLHKTKQNKKPKESKTFAKVDKVLDKVL